MFSYLFSGQPYSGVDIIGTKAMMREKAVRDAFLGYLERHPPHFALDIPSYTSLCEVLGTLAEESKNAKDFASLERVFNSASRYGTLCSQLQIPLKASFDESTAWLSDEFWVHHAVHLVRQDINQWTKLCFIFKENRIDQGDLFSCMTNAEIKALLVIIRVQAIISSLRSLGIQNERIQGLLLKISVLLGLKDSNLDIKLTASKEFILRLMDMAGEVFLPHLVQRCQQQQQQPMQAWSIYSEMRTQNNRLEFVELSDHSSSLLRHDIGYCPVLELLFAVNVHMLRMHQEEGGTTSTAATATSSSTGSAAIHGTTNLLQQLDACSSNSQNQLCICGSSISHWKFLGQGSIDMSPQLRRILAVLEVEMADRESSAGNHSFSSLRERTYERTPYFDTEKAMPGMLQQKRSHQQLVQKADSNSNISSSSKLMKLLPHMLCERCYRHCMSSALTVEAEQLQCVGFCSPIPASTLSDELVSFDEIFHVTCSRQEFVDYQRLEQQRSPQVTPRVKAISDIDFSGFERLLAAELKTATSNSVNSPTAQQAAGDRRSQLTQQSPSTNSAARSNSKGSGSNFRSSSNLQVDADSKTDSGSSSGIIGDGIQGIRVRNSRDLRSDNFKSPPAGSSREIEIMTGSSTSDADRSHGNTPHTATWRSVQSKCVEPEINYGAGMNTAAATAAAAAIATAVDDYDDDDFDADAVAYSDDDVASVGSDDVDYRAEEKVTASTISQRDNRQQQPHQQSESRRVPTTAAAVPASREKSSQQQFTKSGRSVEELHIIPGRPPAPSLAAIDSYDAGVETAVARKVSSTASTSVKTTSIDVDVAGVNTAVSDFVSPSSADPMQSTAAVSEAMGSGGSNKLSAPAVPRNPVLSPILRKLELIQFITRMWDGEIVKIVFSTQPLVEMERMVYLRASSDRSNRYIKERLVSHRDGFSDESAAVDAISSLPLFICWTSSALPDSTAIVSTANGGGGDSGAVPSSSSSKRLDHRDFVLEFNPKKALDVDEIRHIKVGAGKRQHCIMLGTVDKTLVLKIEEEKLFSDLLAGFTFLIASRSSNFSDRR